MTADAHQLHGALFVSLRLALHVIELWQRALRPGARPVGQVELLTIDLLLQLPSSWSAP